MADTKLSALTELAATPANDDEVYIRDVSEAAADESKRITVTNLMAAGGATIVRKTADQTVNNSETLVNDTHLLFPVGISEVWLIFLRLRILIEAGASQAVTKIAFTVPTNGAFQWNSARDIGILAGTNMLTEVTTAEVDQTGYAGVNKQTFIWGTYIGGDTAGNLQLQWAQKVAEAKDTKMLTNSYIIAHKLS